MTEPEVTLKDIWTLLCSMDRDINERFDRINVNSSHSTAISLL
jgi:hypothetical protein